VLQDYRKSIINLIFRAPTVHELMVLLAFFSLCALQLSGIANDPGLGWHLESGRYILDNLSIPKTDPFLASLKPRAWMAEQWLGSLSLYSFYQLLDWWGLYAFTIIVFIYSFLILLYKVIKNYEIALIPTSLACLLAFKSAQIHFILRPVFLSFTFFILAIYLVQKILRKKISVTLGLVLILFNFALWANVHPSFFIGFALIAFEGLVSLIIKDFDRFKKAFAIGIAALTGSLLTPYGLKLHYNVLWLSNSFVVQFYTEWQPIKLDSSEGEFFLIILTAIFFGLLNKKFWRADLIAVFLLSALLAFQTFKAVRMLPYFAISSAVLVALSLELSWRRLVSIKIFQLLKEPSKKIEYREALSNSGLRAFLICIAILLICYPKFPLHNGNLGQSPKNFPVEAVQNLLTSDIDNAPKNVFHEFDWGGYITFNGEGRIRATIDDRSILLGEKYMKNYIKILNCEVDYKGYFEQYKINYVLVRQKSKFAKALSVDSSAKVLFEDNLAVLYFYQI
jgi:hypothetical protein